MTEELTSDQLRIEQDEVLREVSAYDPEERCRSLAHQIVVLRDKLKSARNALAEEGLPIP